MRIFHPIRTQIRILQENQQEMPLSALPHGKKKPTPPSYGYFPSNRRRSQGTDSGRKIPAAYIHLFLPAKHNQKGDHPRDCTKMYVYDNSLSAFRSFHS